MGQRFTQLQQKQRQRDKLKLYLFGLLLAVVSVISLSVGDIWLPPNQWLSEEARLFVWQLRLPRTLAVMVVGAGLAMSGAVMQSLFDNPLSEPGLLGVANGAGVALVLTILLGGSLMPVWLLSMNAIIGALVLTLILLGLSRRRLLPGARLLLIGFALGIVCSAIMTWAVYFSSSMDLRQLLYWLMGSFGGIGWQQKWLILALVPAIVWLSYQGNKLNLLSLGETQSRQLGIPLVIWRNIFVLIIAWAVGVSVALAGIIGFIGLIIPHMLRLIGITDHRYLLTGCALAGSGLLLLADLVSRIALSSAELPIGVITSTIGAPLFIWMLLRNAKTY
ncbi:vitamin B12 ABC transporter permease BtuC [Pragia fontium]|uniref:Vitamin B12 import system permease protein BtuC n=2 Tax=Pragia fontium TaxID=82985 RepID=A0AAJ5BGM6_9GAMM|nr:vitamin B12 ABC transporter permease BtuC [Pragia fontium]GKX61870.1 vitamin B12 import system permease protein BtuC [Pragia fontium]SFC50308.1 vitamin B12 transport system permease protein [Pragia fontium DSM 5563 = ATCC 49100]SUB82335.1 Vitamin B12 import system permease protein BtuC [Pragia fontium]VEJ55194.1 Vitamin B12 import system permease protein BtuC [Pragia fontium]